MRKLMFAVAAMTAGIAMADVTSANVVGYSNNSITKGYSLSAIQFNTIGAAKKSYKLSELVPTHANGSPVDDAGGRLSIQTFTKSANLDKQYFWVGPEDDEDSYPTLGWYDGYDEDASEVELPMAKGFMISNPFANNEIKFVFKAL